MRNQLRKILENSSIPLEELALDVFRETIHELGNVKHSVALSKLDKAQILTGHVNDRQLEKLYSRMADIHDSGIFHGKAYNLTGFARVSRKRLRERQPASPVSIYLKLDIVSSTDKLAQYGEPFEEQVRIILEEAKVLFGTVSGQLLAQEGDALYFSFPGEPDEGSCDLFDGTLSFISWLEEYNLFHNSLGDPAAVKLVGLSIPAHKDDRDKQTITDRLTEFEKKFGRGDSLVIDENIWKHVPVNVNNLVRKFYISDGMFYGMYKRFAFSGSFVRESILC
ncbi:hypothetical protein [Spirochaeta isovalerica]|uniref:Uncharacterized protein n=1 Tax=Spirochaeta isovalerica TaxID=150 RepID=A0A841REK8_9SPIO|nr:hypothetical protein [Spirochaeta isovalerica]MBB6481821.1 hypothetical protein [Spirochaeta isovalerica]